MISISNNLIPLNEKYAIVGNDAAFHRRIFNFRNIGSWTANFFKKYLNVFNYIYKLYKYFLTAATVVYYFVCIVLIGLVFFYGYRLLAFLTQFFIRDICNYFKKKNNENKNNIQCGEQLNNVSTPQAIIQPQALPPGIFC